MTPETKMEDAVWILMQDTLRTSARIGRNRVEKLATTLGLSADALETAFGDALTRAITRYAAQEEQVVAASALRFTDVTVDLTEYTRHHGRMPRGDGDWWFALGGLGGKSFHHVGGYSAGSKAARTAAAAAGHTNIYLCP